MADSALSTCPFCSMGCVWRLKRGEGSPYPGEPSPATLDYAADTGPNRGSLCAKGNLSLELMTHPRRLEAPLVREGGSERAASWDEALALAADRIAGIREAHGSRAVGLLLGPHLSNEEAAGAVRLARAIGTPHVDLCEPEDHAVTRGIEMSTARPARVRPGADFFNTLEMMVQKLGAHPVALQIPWGREDGFQGVVDLIKNKAIIWNDDTLGTDFELLPVPAELQEQAGHCRHLLLEAVVEKDDAIMEQYLSGSELSEEEIKSVLRKATLDMSVVPVLCGAGLRNKGIQPLLDSIVDYLPSPQDVPPVEGVNPETQEKESRRSSSDEPFAALAFKVAMDEGRKLTYIRVYSGKLETGEEVYNATRQTKEKVARLFKMHANKKERIADVRAGDIIAAAGLRDTTTGDTLCTPRIQWW